MPIWKVLYESAQSLARRLDTSCVLTTNCPEYVIFACLGFSVHVCVLSRVTLYDSVDCSPLGSFVGEGNGTPLQYFCLENPVDGGVWWAAVHGVARVGHD